MQLSKTIDDIVYVTEILVEILDFPQIGFIALLSCKSSHAHLFQMIMHKCKIWGLFRRSGLWPTLMLILKMTYARWGQRLQQWQCHLKGWAPTRTLPRGPRCMWSNQGMEIYDRHMTVYGGPSALICAGVPNTAKMALIKGHKRHSVTG